MLCLEWWAYEVMTLMSGYLGVTEQASQIVLMNLIAFLFMAACGFQTAAGALIGQQIGKNDVAKAKQYYYVASHLAFVFLAIVVALFVYFKEVSIGLFTNIKSVKDLCESVVWIAAMGVFPDCWQGYL